jgi:hypothetical protein
MDANSMDKLYTVLDRASGKIIAVDLTLTAATRLRDALTTLGDPVIRETYRGETEGSVVPYA